MIDVFKIVDCPFCEEINFDLAGLKEHIQKYYCDVYYNLERLEAEAMKQRQSINPTTKNKD